MTQCDQNGQISNATENVAALLYRMNGFAWYGRDLGDWDDATSTIASNGFERDRWLRQAREVLA